MSEQGTRFKTGFLAPNIDYGAIGQGVAASFANPILAVAQERAVQRDAKMKALNPMGAAGEAVPGQINQKYQGAAQLALDIYQEAATNFELDPSGDNEAAFAQAKNQYLSIVEDAKFGTQFIAKKTAEIKGNTELAEQGLLESNINAINEYAVLPVYTRQGNVVMVGQGVDAKDYFTSGITASNADNLFYETGSIVGDYKFLGSAVGKEVFNSQFATKKGLSASQGGYQETQIVPNISQPVVVGFDEEGFSADVADQYNVFAKNNRTMWNASAMEGYKSMYAGNRDLQSGDLNAINNTMHPELFSLRNSKGVSISKVTGFETDGTPIYALSTEDIEAGIASGEMQFIDAATGQPASLPSGITMDEINNFRNGETVHAREYYNTIRGQFPQVDEDAVAEMLSGATTGPTGLTRTIFTAYNADDQPAADPTLANTYPDMTVGSIASGGNFKSVTVSNVGIDVEKAIIDLSTGQVIGYKIAKDQELIDRLQSMQGRTQSQTDLLALLTEEADIYVNSETDSAAFNNIKQQLEGQERTGKASTYNTLLGQAMSQLGPILQQQNQSQSNQNINNLNQGVGGANPLEEGGVIPGGTNGDDETNGDQKKKNGDQKMKYDPVSGKMVPVKEKDSEELKTVVNPNMRYDSVSGKMVPVKEKDSEELETVVNPNMRYDPVSGNMVEITDEEQIDEPVIEDILNRPLAPEVLPGKEAGPIDTGVETPNLLAQIVSYNEPTRKEKRKAKRSRKRDDKDIARMTKEAGGQEVIDEFKQEFEETLAEQVALNAENKKAEIEAEAKRIEEQKALIANGLTMSDEKITEFMGGYLQGLVPNPFNPDNQEQYDNAGLLAQGSDTYEFDLANMILRFGMPGEGTEHYEAAQALDINKYGITTAEFGAAMPNTATLINRGAPLSDFIDFNESKEKQALSLLTNVFNLGETEGDIVEDIEQMFLNVTTADPTNPLFSTEAEAQTYWDNSVDQLAEEKALKYQDYKQETDTTLKAAKKKEYYNVDPVMAWCAIFIGDLMLQADPEQDIPQDVSGDRFGAVRAKAYASVGDNIFDNPSLDIQDNNDQIITSAGARVGDVVVMKNEYGGNHVGLYAGMTEDGDVLLFGGNQGDKVSLIRVTPFEMKYKNAKETKMENGVQVENDTVRTGIISIRRVTAPLLNPAEAEAISILAVQGGAVAPEGESTR